MKKIGACLKAGIVLVLFLYNYSVFSQTGIQVRNIGWVDSEGARIEPESIKTYNVTEYGAVADSFTVNTVSIQKAIDDCARNGGGTVYFQPGVYVTGSVFLKSGVNFKIDKGVELWGSQNLEDYPDIYTRAAGIELYWPAALINIINQKNVSVTGNGIVNGRGKPFWDSYWALRKDYEPRGLRWIVDYDSKRPRTLLVQESNDVSVKDLTFQQAGFWTIHILYSSYITVSGVIIRNNINGHGPSTDGIDIDSSTKILVENCDIDCNDDNFCLKAGRDADGLRVNKPTEYVVIRNCIAGAGGGLITFGSETSGSIRNVVASNLRAKGTTAGIRFKSAFTRGGTVENIYISDVTMEEVLIPLDIALNWNPNYSYSQLPEGYNPDSIPAHWKTLLQKVDPPQKGLPEFKNVYISNIHASGSGTALFVAGSEKSIVKNFSFTNVYIEAAKPGIISYADNWKFENVSILVPGKNQPEVTNSTNMQLGE